MFHCYIGFRALNDFLRFRALFGLNPEQYNSHIIITTYVFKVELEYEVGWIRVTTFHYGYGINNPFNQT